MYKTYVSGPKCSLVLVIHNHRPVHGTEVTKVIRVDTTTLRTFDHKNVFSCYKKY